MQGVSPWHAQLGTCDTSPALYKVFLSKVLWLSMIHGRSTSWNFIGRKLEKKEGERESRGEERERRGEGEERGGRGEGRERRGEGEERGGRGEGEGEERGRERRGEGEEMGGKREERRGKEKNSCTVFPTLAHCSMT